jgi:hypothetical protein
MYKQQIIFLLSHHLIFFVFARIVSSPHAICGATLFQCWYIIRLDQLCWACWFLLESFAGLAGFCLKAFSSINVLAMQGLIITFTSHQLLIVR